MRRRELIVLTSAVLLPRMSRAQQPGRTYRLGPLSPLHRDDPPYVALFDELRRRGFIEGQNLTIDPRGYGLRGGQFSVVAKELVDAGVDVVLATGDVAIRAAQQATATVPILGSADDMVGSRLVASMARPGGNTTGTSMFSTELDGKRQEILTQIVPGVRRIAALADINLSSSSHLDALRGAAQVRGIEVVIYRVANPDEVVAAIGKAKADGAQALNVLASPFLRGNEQMIRERVAALRLPAIYQFPEMAEAGGLAGYGPRIDQLYRHEQAELLIKLLAGAKPAALPIEQPTKFELVINLKTAKALALHVPQLLLAQADEVIE
jgi:putative tryptophan/tyrosine transport system substrate-binding protein